MTKITYNRETKRQPKLVAMFKLLLAKKLKLVTAESSVINLKTFKRN